MDALWTSMIDYVNSLPADTENTLHAISTFKYQSPITEIRAELPSVMNLSACYGTLMRWFDIKDHLNNTMRVYALSYNADVERWFYQAVQSRSGILLTIIPGYWKERYHRCEE